MDLDAAQREPTWVRSLQNGMTINLQTLSQPVREPWEDGNLEPPPLPPGFENTDLSPEEEDEDLSPEEEVKDCPLLATPGDMELMG